MSRTLIQGWGAPPMADQFPELPEKVTNRMEAINLAIVELRMAGMLTDSVHDNLRQKRFPKFVGEQLADHAKAIKL